MINLIVFQNNSKNLYGHRYAIEVTVKGDIIDEEQKSDFGMVMDFKDAKELIRQTIVTPWDHAFIVYEKDHEVINFLATLKDHKTVIFSKVPTAENMALVAMERLKKVFYDNHQTMIIPIKARLYETPNNWAEAF